MKEDVGPGDVTTRDTMVFRAVDKGISFQALVRDGEPVQPWDVAAEVVGSLEGILTAERTLLNLLTCLSGIATLTAKVRGGGGPIPGGDLGHLQDHSWLACFREIRGPMW